MNLSRFIIYLSIGCFLCVSTSAKEYRDKYGIVNRKDKTSKIVTAVKEKNNFYIAAAYSEVDQKVTHAVNTTLDDSDKGFQLSVGFHFNPYISTEVSLVELGEIIKETNGTTEKFRVDSVNLTLVGKIPLSENFQVYGKVGFSEWQAQSDIVTGAVTSRIDDRGRGLFYGAGASYALTTALDIYAEHTIYDIDPSFNSVKYDTDVSAMSVGLRWTFVTGSPEVLKKKKKKRSRR